MMNPSSQTDSVQKNLALWSVVIVEALVIIIIGAYNIYEIRRNSELVQSKIQGLAEYSARQGEKLDRMTTALDGYMGRRISTDETAVTNTAATDQKVEKAIEFLETWKQKNGKAQPGDAPTDDPAPSVENPDGSGGDSHR